jgi:hypothetical protein
VPYPRTMHTKAILATLQSNLLGTQKGAPLQTGPLPQYSSWLLGLLNWASHGVHKTPTCSVACCQII